MVVNEKVRMASRCSRSNNLRQLLPYGVIVFLVFTWFTLHIKDVHRQCSDSDKKKGGSLMVEVVRKLVSHEEYGSNDVSVDTIGIEWKEIQNGKRGKRIPMSAGKGGGTLKYAQRVLNAQDVCLQYERAGLGKNIREISRQVLEHMLVDDQHKFLYCNIPKAGSTNWKRLMLALRNKNITSPMDIPGDKAHEIHLPKLTEFSKNEIQQRLKDYIKFVFVRHPLERLYSAYRDKFAKRDPYFNKHFGTPILRRLRPGASAKEISSGMNVTFSEFLSYLLLPDIHTKPMDHHWERYMMLCNPCAIRYNIIGKFESMDEDANHILAKVGAEAIHLPTRNESFGPVGAHEMWRRAITEAGKDLDLNKLIEIYQLDFEIFGYKTEV